MKRFFSNLYQSKKSKARLGEINTSHGTIKTPAFVPVGTKGTIKALLPALINEIKIQVAFVNTYHLVTHPGAEIIEKAGGIHKFANLSIPLMSDSGGFQVFSLARKNKSEIRNSKFEKNPKNNSNLKFQISNFSNDRPMIEKISDDGVKFRSVFDGELIEFTPEKSMEYQRMIGADINMAFDECTYYPAAYKYAEKAMRRTHEWLRRCVQYIKSELRNSKSKTNSRSEIKNSKQNNLDLENSNLFSASNFEIRNYLYGVIQGATSEDLRRQSAEFVVNQNVDGIAIGGVSVGETKDEMREQVAWVADYLPKDKPVHLLGVGQIDDIVDLVKHGIDTFDCVEPTRLARMGILLQIQNSEFRIQNDKTIKKTEILKGKYRYDLSKVDERCNCYVCTNFTKSYLHHLFKQREILGYNLATYHNLWVMERLMEGIRRRIREDKL